MNNLSLIAAIGKNNELGYKNKLIWRFPEDMKFFKANTINKPIIMGYNTFESLPKLLPKRKHIVLTSKNIEIPNVIIVHSIEEILNFVKNENSEVMVIGGARVYSELINYSSKLILTEINDEAKADTYFPNFDKNDWDNKIIDENIYNNIKYKHLVYTRKNNNK